jgi:hypothetical protein
VLKLQKKSILSLEKEEMEKRRKIEEYSKLSSRELARKLVEYEQKLERKNIFQKIKKFLRRQYFIVDRDMKISKIFYLILKLSLQQKLENMTIYDLAKEYLKKKKLKNNEFTNFYWFVRQLEKHKFVYLEGEKGKGRKKKKRIRLISAKIYFSLLCKLWNEGYLSFPLVYVNGNDVLSYFSQLPLDRLFSVKDCEDFISGKSEETPLSKAVKRVWIYSYELSKLANFPRYKFAYDKILEAEFPMKPFFLLAKEVQRTPSKETIEEVQKELKELGLWNEQIEEQIEEILESWKRKILKNYILPKLKEYRRKLYEYIKKAEKGVWDEFFNSYL